jgi:hypothetical protein
MSGSPYKERPENYAFLVDMAILLSMLFLSVTALPIFVYFTNAPWSETAVVLAMSLSFAIFGFCRNQRKRRAAERMRADFEAKYNALKANSEARYAALKNAFDSLVSPSDCTTLRTAKVNTEGLQAYFGSSPKTFRLEMGIGKLPVVFDGWNLGWKVDQDCYCRSTSIIKASAEAGIFITTGETIVAYLKSSELFVACLHWPIVETGLGDTPWKQFDDMMNGISDDPLSSSKLRAYLLVEAWKDACKRYPRLEGLSLRTID